MTKDCSQDSLRKESGQDFELLNLMNMFFSFRMNHFLNFLDELLDFLVTRTILSIPIIVLPLQLSVRSL